MRTPPHLASCQGGHGANNAPPRSNMPPSNHQRRGRADQSPGGRRGGDTQGPRDALSPALYARVSAVDENARDAGREGLGDRGRRPVGGGDERQDPPLPPSSTPAHFQLPEYPTGGYSGEEVPPPRSATRYSNDHPGRNTGTLLGDGSGTLPGLGSIAAARQQAFSAAGRSLRQRPPVLNQRAGGGGGLQDGHGTFEQHQQHQQQQEHGSDGELCYCWSLDLCCFPDSSCLEIVGNPR